MEQNNAYNYVAKKVILDFYKNKNKKSLCITYGTVPEVLSDVLMNTAIKLINKGNSAKYTTFCDKYNLAENMYASDILNIDLYHGKFDIVAYEKQLEEDYSVF